MTTIEKARKILGNDVGDLSDAEIQAIIDALTYLSKKLLDNE